MPLPFGFDVTSTRAPIANALLIGATCAVFVLSFFHIIPGNVIDVMALKDWSLSGIFGCVFLHANLLILLGNMFFLWIFGNAVCSTIGNTWYVSVYFLLALLSSSIYLATGVSADPGSSAVVCGIVGISLIFFPSSKVYWMTALWLAFDIMAFQFWGAEGGYWGHIGGFIGGMSVATVLLITRAVINFDPTVIDILTGKRPRNIIDSEESFQSATRPSYPQTDARGELRSTYIINGRRGRPVDLEAERIHRLMTGETKSRPRAKRKPSGPPLNLRVFRMKSEANHTTCYFINEGEEIHDLVATSRGGLTVGVHPPNSIRRGEPGWFTFITYSGTIPSNPRFILEYTTMSGERHRRTMAVSEYDNRILSGAEA